jgi:hypothetical protein
MSAGCAVAGHAEEASQQTGVALDGRTLEVEAQAALAAQLLPTKRREREMRN